MTSAPASELAFLDATAQADLVRTGSISSEELIEDTLSRIDRVNPSLNAVIHRRDEAALQEARAGKTGLFAGVPILLKDAVAQSAGDPYHLGMRVLKERDWRAHEDSWLTSRLRSAGFILVGRTNTPELAGSITTEPLAYGPTRNPWDLERSPGGSSGGSAAAVASGLTAIAHGNDMGGSA